MKNTRNKILKFNGYQYNQRISRYSLNIRFNNVHARPLISRIRRSSVQQLLRNLTHHWQIQCEVCDTRDVQQVGRGDILGGRVGRGGRATVDG